jgi:AhpD family alkylhydroperoxidase
MALSRGKCTLLYIRHAPLVRKWVLQQNLQEEKTMATDMYPRSTKEIQEQRHALAPKPLDAFHTFSRQVFAEGALDAKVKQLIAVAVAHTTQCPYCIQGHTAGALNAGASEPGIVEAIWVAAEMRAGATYAHSTIALNTMQEYARKHPQ